MVRIAVLAAALALAALPAAAQVRIGLMVSATGPTSAIGIPQKNTGDLLPRSLGGLAIEYVQLDDGGDTTRGVQNAKKLLQEHNIDALIGPSTTPIALAILDLVAEQKVPLMATVGTSSVVEPLDAKRRRLPASSRADLALDLGYADQAHFNHEFRRFSAVAPGAFLRLRGEDGESLVLG